MARISRRKHPAGLPVQRILGLTEVTKELVDKRENIMVERTFDGQFNYKDVMDFLYPPHVNDLLRRAHHEVVAPYYVPTAKISILGAGLYPVTVRFDVKYESMGYAVPKMEPVLQDTPYMGEILRVLAEMAEVTRQWGRVRRVLSQMDTLTWAKVKFLLPTLASYLPANHIFHVTHVREPSYKEVSHIKSDDLRHVVNTLTVGTLIGQSAPPDRDTYMFVGFVTGSGDDEHSSGNFPLV